VLAKRPRYEEKSQVAVGLVRKKKARTGPDSYHFCFTFGRRLFTTGDARGSSKGTAQGRWGRGGGVPTAKFGVQPE